MSIPGSKSAPVQVTFSGNGTVQLTGSYVQSDPVLVDFAKRLTVIPSYSAGGSASTLDFTFDVNPFDESSDPSGSYWCQAGSWCSDSGHGTEVPMDYSVTAGSVGVYRNGTPLDISNLNASRIRIRVKESGTVGGNARLFIVKSDIS
jgi:hypothetical protein